MIPMCSVVVIVLVCMVLFCGTFATVMLKVCAAHGEPVSDVYGVCHLMLIVPYYHYCAVVCLYMMN